MMQKHHRSSFSQFTSKAGRFVYVLPLLAALHGDRVPFQDAQQSPSSRQVYLSQVERQIDSDCIDSVLYAKDWRDLARKGILTEAAFYGEMPGYATTLFYGSGKRATVVLFPDAFSFDEKSLMLFLLHEETHACDIYRGINGVPLPELRGKDGYVAKLIMETRAFGEAISAIPEEERNANNQLFLEAADGFTNNLDLLTLSAQVGLSPNTRALAANTIRDYSPLLSELHSAISVADAHR